MLQKYPPHLYDPLRRKIAESFIQHELRKLFPSVKESATWDLVDEDVRQWFSQNPIMTPVAHFWNGFHAISRGFRYKNLLYPLTSKHISWEEREVNLFELWFGVTFETLDFIGPFPSVNKVKIELNKKRNQEAKEKLFTKLKNLSKVSASRDDDPVLVQVKDKIPRVVDGNRRVFLAMCEGKEKILAFFGKPTALPEIFEHWVAYPFLADLISLHSNSSNIISDAKILTQVIARVIFESIKDSTVAQQEWDRLVKFPQNDKESLLGNEVQKLLNLKNP